MIWTLTHTHEAKICTQTPKNAHASAKIFTKKYRKAEYVHCPVRFVNVQSSLHENVVFSVCAHVLSRMLYLSCGILFPV